MPIIENEMHTGKFRLLTISGELPKELKDEVIINGKKYRSVVVYDMPNSIAIECSNTTPSLIGCSLSI